MYPPFEMDLPEVNEVPLMMRRRAHPALVEKSERRNGRRWFRILKPGDDINAAQAPALNDVIREKTADDVLSLSPHDPTLDLRNYKYQD